MPSGSRSFSSMNVREKSPRCARREQIDEHREAAVGARVQRHAVQRDEQIDRDQPRLLRPADADAALPRREDEHQRVADVDAMTRRQRRRAAEEQLRELQREQTEQQRARIERRGRDERHAS